MAPLDPPIEALLYDHDIFMSLLLVCLVIVVVVVGRYGRAATQNPIPSFDGPIPPREAFAYDRVVFMPSKDMRPLLVHQANVFRYVQYTQSKNR